MAYKPKKRNKHLWEKLLKKIFFKFLLPFTVLFVASIFLVNADFFSVKKISFINIKNIDEKRLQEISQSSLDGKYFGLYSKRNFILYPESQWENNLKKSEKKIKLINISYSGLGGNIEVDIEEKIAEYIYCENVRGKCYFMESGGEIFTKFVQKETGILKKDFLVFSEKLGNKNIPENFLQKKDFEKIIALTNELKNIGIGVKKIEKRTYGETVFLTKNNSKIVFQIDQDFSKITKTLKKLSIRKDLKINKVKKDFENKIEYVNLSHGENIFYCLVGEICKNNY